LVCVLASYSEVNGFDSKHRHKYYNNKYVSITTTNHLKSGVVPTSETSCTVKQIYLRQWPKSNLILVQRINNCQTPLQNQTVWAFHFLILFELQCHYGLSLQTQ